MAKIKATVVVRNPDSGEVVTLREGDNAPAWASKVISNPAVLDSRSGRSSGDSDNK